MLARFALVLGVSLAAVAPMRAAEAATSQRGALVRVEVIEDGARTRSSKTVTWDHTASLSLDVGGHAHRLAITPSRRDRGVALSVDHDRDGDTMANDLRVTSAERRVVIEEGDTRVVVTVVPVTMHLDTDG
ncbi:MAG TPA: hypothetical protein VG755_36695 [Nannocystaceae bacterium]|nr:hypothetical protein [Nannocystaceae bacterium]